MKASHQEAIVCFITSLVTLLYFSYVSADEPAQTPTTPAPHTQYPLLYSFNAHRAIVSLQPNYGNAYQLVLQDVHPQVAYQIHTAKVKSGTISISQFLKLWPKQTHVTGNLTGVQIDPNMGHKQFYQVVKLFNPQYQASQNEITFNVIFTQPDKPTNALEEMENATLFINGCDLCECKAGKVICNY
jgi:hypothetical protein